MHFITVCPYFRPNRDRILIKSHQGNTDWVLQEILDFSHIPEISEIMDRYGHYSKREGDQVEVEEESVVSTEFESSGSDSASDGMSGE